MKKQFILFFLLLFLASSAFSQKIDRYVPFKFKGIQPIWMHVVKDTSQLPSDTLGLFNYLFYDKVSQRIVGPSLYTLYSNLSGLFIDQVNLKTGESEKSFVFDRRHVPSIKEIIPLGLFIDKEENINCVGIREYTIDMKPNRFLEYFHLDKQDLSLIEHYFHPKKDTSSAYLDWQYIDYTQIIPHSDTGIYVYKYRSATDTSSQLVYDKIHSQILSFSENPIRDTLVTVDTSAPRHDFDIEKPQYHKIFHRGKSILGYLSFKYYGSDSIISALKFYDQNLNFLESHDIHQYFDANTIFSSIDHIDDNYIYLICTKPSSLFSTRYWTYLIIDFDGNLVEKIPLKGNYGRMPISDTKVIRIPDMNKTLVFYNDLEKQRFFLLQTRREGVFDLISSYEMAPLEMSFRPTSITRLENGDILLHGAQIQYTLDTIKGQKRVYPIAKIIMRWDKSILQTLSSKTNTSQQDFFSLHSNPVMHHHTHIYFKQPFNGTVQLSDISGRKIKQWDLSQKSHYSLNLPFLPKGTYLITPIPRGQSVYKTIQSKKLLVE